MWTTHADEVDLLWRSHSALRAGNIRRMETDVLGAPYESQVIALRDDDEGSVTATLVRRRADVPTGAAARAAVTAERRPA